jgi:hypothetical protein
MKPLVMSNVDEPDTRVIAAVERANQALAEANAANERGDHETAKTLYARYRFWCHNYNNLTGRKSVNE